MARIPPLALALLLAAGAAPSRAQDPRARDVVWEGSFGREGLDYAADGSLQRYRVAEDGARAQVGAVLADEPALAREAPELHRRWQDVVEPLRAAIAALLRDESTPETRRAATSALATAAVPEGPLRPLTRGYLLVCHLLHRAGAASTSPSALRRLSQALAQVHAADQAQLTRLARTWLDAVWQAAHDPAQRYERLFVDFARWQGGLFHLPDGALAAVVVVEGETTLREDAPSGGPPRETRFPDPDALRAERPDVRQAWDEARGR